MIWIFRAYSKWPKWVLFTAVPVGVYFLLCFYLNNHFPSEKEMWCVAGITVGSGLFINGFQREKLRRKMKDTPTAKVRSMALGSVELAGFAKPITEPLVDPIFKEPCVYFSIKVDEERGTGKNRTWVTIYDKNSNTVPFYLQDLTGRVLVIPYGAENEAGLKISETYYSTNFSMSGIDSPAQLFMVQVGGSGGRKQLHARIIRENMPLYVLGFAQTLPNRFRDSIDVSEEEAGRLLKKNPEKMKGLDANKDGQIDGFEWETGVLNFKKELEAQRKRETDKKEKDGSAVFTQPLFVGESPDTSFIIASDESEMGNRLGWLAFLQIFSGPILTAGSAWFLVKYFSGISK